MSCSLDYFRPPPRSPFSPLKTAQGLYISVCELRNYVLFVRRKQGKAGWRGRGNTLTSHIPSLRASPLPPLHPCPTLPFIYTLLHPFSLLSIPPVIPSSETLQCLQTHSSSCSPRIQLFFLPLVSCLILVCFSPCNFPMFCAHLCTYVSFLLYSFNSRIRFIFFHLSILIILI
jgi:hypothetical protein